MANEDKRIIELPASTSILNDDWIAKDSASQDTTRLQLSFLKQLCGGNNFAGEWQSGTTYSKDSYVTHEGKLYHNIKGGSVVAVNWTSSQWQEIDVSSELKKVVGSLAPTFDSSTNYDVDDLVTFNGGLCRCISPHSSGAWNSSHFANVTVSSLLTYFIMDNFTDRRWEKYSGSPVNYTKGTVIHKGLSMYRCKANTTNQSWDSSKWEQVDVTDLINSVTVLIETVLSNLAPTFSSSAQYSINDFVLYNNQLYICMKPHHGSWDPLDFGTGKIGDILEGIFNNIADVYNPSGSYVKGDVVNYLGMPLRCIVDTATSPMVFSEWERVTVEQLIDEKVADVQIAGQTTADENKISDLTSLTIEGTASGEIASFSDGSNLPMRSFVCNIDAVQDLHGYDGPWVGGAGKNKLPMTVDGIKTATTSGTWSNNDYTLNGVTFTVLTDSDGNVTGIKVNGTAPADTALSIPVDTNKLYGDLYFVGCSGGSSNTYNVYMWDTTAGGRAKKWDGTTASTTSLDGTFQQVKIVQGNTVYMRLRVMAGQTVENIVFYPMICLPTETATTFAPYSNICPISGHTGVDAWVRGKNLLSINSLSLNRDTQRAISSNINPIPKGTYTISWAYSGTSQNTSFILRKSQNDQTDQKQFAITDGTQGTFTIDETYSAIYAFIGTNQASGTTAEISNLMIRPSTDTSTTFEPYNPSSQTIQVSWQTEAGEVYGGYVDLVSGVLTVTHKEITYNGSNDITWQMSTGGTDENVWHQFYTTNTSIKNSLNAICNRFPTKDISNRGSDSILVAFNDRTFRIALKDSDLLITSVEDFKTWLSTNNLQIVYELETPLTYQLTPTQIKSLLGKNNAWRSTGDVNVKFNKDATTVINSLIARIEALENA